MLKGGPIESRVLTPFRCWREPHWKLSTCTLQLLLRVRLEAITHYSSCWGPFESRALSFDLLRCILWVDNTFFTKNDGIYTQNTSRDSWKGGARGKRPARLPFQTHHWSDFFIQSESQISDSLITQIGNRTVETSVPEFPGILPEVSTNQNFWGCACTSCTSRSYTTASVKSYYPNLRCPG